jgi:DNA-binding HxlR family transcriptional regulator
MKEKNKKRQSGCPLAFWLDVFGDRWSLLVVREIMIKGKKTYSDFLEAEEGIATNILIDRLKHLEAEGILLKSRDPENRRSFIYTLTPKGLGLVPIILEIVRWSDVNDHRPQAMQGVLAEVEKTQKAINKKIAQAGVDPA